MIKTDISFDKAVANVTHFLSKDKKSKTNLEKANTGFTCFANSVKVLQQHAAYERTVPTKAKAAQELLDKYKGEKV